MKNALLFLLTITFFNSIAQKNTSSFVSDLPYIEVIGTATREIEPDQIYVSITLTEKSIDNKKYSIELQEEKLGQILTSLNIDPKNLVLSDLNSRILRDKKNEIGFKQSKEYTLLLNNSNDVSKLFRQLFESNIREADIEKVQHTKLTDYTKEVRIEAIKAAKEKATYLLEAIGKTIDQPLEISENNRYTSSEDNNYYRGNVYSKKDASEAISSSEFKKIILSMSYRVKYSIK